LIQNKIDEAGGDKLKKVKGNVSRLMKEISEVEQEATKKGVQVKSGGIYNKRRVRGGTAWSLHSVGRGIDWAVPSKETGDEIFLRLINAADQCGVCEIIWNRQRWDGTTGKVKPYRGTNPHTDHVHAGMVIDVAAHPDTGDLRRWFDHYLFQP
jgi:hypothetical protein